MTDATRGSTWLRIAVVYFVLGVSLGIVMGATNNFTLRPVHVHLNLLGWVSMALFGLIGHFYPATLRGRVANIQFWLYNLGVPTLLALLTALLLGNAAVGPVLGAVSVVVGVAVLLFAYLVLANVKAPAATNRVTG